MRKALSVLRRVWTIAFDVFLTLGFPFYTIWNAMEGNATQAAIFGFLWGTNVMTWMIRFEQWSNKRRERLKNGDPA